MTSPGFSAIRSTYPFRDPKSIQSQFDRKCDHNSAGNTEDTDELFYAEAERTVKRDNRFSFQGDRYETPVDRRGRKIQSMRLSVFWMNVAIWQTRSGGRVLSAQLTDFKLLIPSHTNLFDDSRPVPITDGGTPIDALF